MKLSILIKSVNFVYVDESRDRRVNNLPAESG
jgi:hypothetical protein